MMTYIAVMTSRPINTRHAW